MGRGNSKIGWLCVIASAIFLLYFTISFGSQPSSKATNARGIPIHSQREAASDLEVTGLLSGLPEGAVGYVRYADLLSLPKVSAVIHGDENFHELKAGSAVTVTGVSLDVLAHALGALPSSDMIDAMCRDEYRAHYPANYLVEHHPILGLTINHQSTAQWAKQSHQYDPSPYFITHADFVPAFKVLAHEDRPQVPTNVLRLNFSTIAATYGAIAPRGTYAQNSPQEEGFTIARQNCFRCHNQGPYGGRKAGRTWATLSTWAREQPEYFKNYVRNPKSFEPMAKMPANPEYDRATLAALTAYFKTFTDTASEGSH
jgi:mono/diheme cytochrome c family protein